MTTKGCVAGWNCTALALLLSLPAGLAAQETSPGAVTDAQSAGRAATAVVHDLFDAMRLGDTTTMRGLFAEGVASFPSSGPDLGGAPAISWGDLDEFLGGVANAEPGSLDERITVRDVIVDDNLATVITPYAFYYQGSLHHCGVDVFLIARQGDAWKIAGLADTRRSNGCEGWLDD